MSTLPDFLINKNDPYIFHTNYSNVFTQDTNDRGTIFGGKLFSEIDLTVAQHCTILLRNSECEDAVTVSASITYHAGAILGDVLRHESTCVKAGIKSLKFFVETYALRKEGNIHISTAELVFVSRKSGQTYPHGVKL